MPVPRLTLQPRWTSDPRVHAGLLAGMFAGWAVALLWAARPFRTDSLLRPWQ